MAKKIYVEEVKSYQNKSVVEGVSRGDMIIIEGDVSDGTSVTVDNTLSMYDTIRQQSL